MLCHADDVTPEIERPEFSGLPEGDYPNVRLLLTEESFHQNCGTWSTVMAAEISFFINWLTPPACEGDFDFDGDADGSDLAAYISIVFGIDLKDLSNDFGRTDCP